MSLYPGPGHHQLVHAKILSWDTVGQTGLVQFIGIYGRNQAGDPAPQLVHNDTRWSTYNNPFLGQHYVPKTAYQPGEWVAVRGIPAGSPAVEDPKNLRQGAQFTAYKTAYYVVGSLKHQPPREGLLDHAADAATGATSFPPLPDPNS